MKKKGILLLLTILGLFIVLGCSQTTSTTGTTPTSTTETTTPSTTTTSTTSSTTTSTTTTSTSTTTTTTTTTALRQLIPGMSSGNLAVGGVLTLTYELTFTPEAGVTVTFTSGDEAVVTVDAAGLVTAVGPGETWVLIEYDEAVYANVHITVTGAFVFIPPTKTIYRPGDNLNLRGGSIEIYDGDELVERISLTSEMVISFDNQTEGSQLVRLLHQGIIYQYAVYLLNEKQIGSLFDDFILLEEPALTGEKIEFALTKSNVAEFLRLVDNVYDYDEVNIYAVFTSPSGKTSRVSAFWYQGYEEDITYTPVNKSLNLEGTVNDKTWDYDLILRYVEENDPQFRLRFQTDEPGDYQCELTIQVDGTRIQSFSKAFTVADNPASDSRGVLGVDPVNSRHFAFADGTTYVPVGQNVAWYTSVQRKYYDYLSWFPRMGEVGMNYARVWMAAWGYSIFWNDVEDYGARQPNMTSLDRTLEIAENQGIYIQLCILHHGMFSAKVNPMWPNSENNWYIAKYGSNPYSEFLANPGLFFTDPDAKESFKNQLDYIVARWGYSDHIMAWELFNEVDWIEEYTAVAGYQWHQEMAAYLKAIDPYGHLVTTSLKGESFNTSMFQVFTLDDIDFVNVHSYGIYNHVNDLPSRQANAYYVFQKPILYDEVGYSGMGGADQHSVDPNNVTLHQALWGGAMGGGAGTGMNWWWESWIETYDDYEEYRGIAAFASQMDLSGEDYRLLTSVSGVTLSHSALRAMGYHFEDRVYAYIYDKNYELANQSVSTKTDSVFTVPGLTPGQYTVRVFDTRTGEVLRNATQTLSSGTSLSVVLPSFQSDLALIITKDLG